VFTSLDINGITEFNIYIICGALFFFYGSYGSVGGVLFFFFCTHLVSLSARLKISGERKAYFKWVGELFQNPV
jgi:hypothetical protein